MKFNKNFFNCFRFTLSSNIMFWDSVAAKGLGLQLIIAEDMMDNNKIWKATRQSHVIP